MSSRNRWLYGATIAMGLTVVAAGCTPQSVTTTPESEFQLESDTIAVVGFSPQITDMSESGAGDHGYLLAIRAHGETQILRTASMSGMKPNWDGDTVYSRDPEHSRATTTRGTISTDDHSDILQDNVYPGVPGYTSVEQYDLGMRDGTDGMVELRARRNDGGVETHRFEASILTPATCDDGVYGFSSLLSSREPESAPGDIVGQPTTLIRVFPRPDDESDPQADVVAKVAEADNSFLPTALTGVCQGTTLYYFGVSSSEQSASLRSVAGLEEPAPDAAPPYLRSWDTKTGLIHDTALSRTDGLPLSVENAKTGPGAIIGDELYWYSPMGTVFASQLDSGATRVAFTTESEPINVAKDANIDEISVVQFGEGTLYRLSSPTRGTAPGSMAGWDLLSGDKTLDVAVPATQAITGEPGNLQIPWGVAVKPDLLRTAGSR